MIAHTTAPESLSSESRFGPGSEFGFGSNAPDPEKNPLPFFSLLTRFGSLTASHGRQVEGQGGPVKSFWAHHLL